jgi:hypothetical protein
MKIIITIKDQENGHVEVKSNPPLPQLIKIYKSGGRESVTPAMTYAILALQKMFRDSEQIQKEIDKDAAEEKAMNSGIIIPWKNNTPQGPQEVV